MQVPMPVRILRRLTKSLHLRFRLSVRAYHRTRSVKLARTIADLAGSEEIQSARLAEALHLRSSEVDAQHNVIR